MALLAVKLLASYHAGGREAKDMALVQLKEWLSSPRAAAEPQLLLVAALIDARAEVNGWAPRASWWRCSSRGGPLPQSTGSSVHAAATQHLQAVGCRLVASARSYLRVR